MFKILRAATLPCLALVCLGLIGIVEAPSASARPLTPAEKRNMPFSGNVPICADPSILNLISDRFAFKESEFWRTGVEISGYQDVLEVGFRSAGLDFAPRRFCVARAVLNDGRKTRVHYVIGEKIGWLGATDGVQWCAEGFDRNFSYGDDCQAARP